MKKIIGTLLGVLVVAGLGLLSFAAQAQDLGKKPIRIIVGVVAGGATDVTARIVAQKMSGVLGIPVIVENKPGAFFEAAYRELTNAAPDGHTLFMISASTVITQPGRKDFPYDIRKMSPISEVSEGPFILVARPAMNFKTVGDLVAYAKANPGKLTFGSGGGAASSLSLAAELLRLRSGITMVNVPYKGAAAALIDLLGGHTDVMFDALPVEVEQVKKGSVVALAVTSRERSMALPDVPTLMESGFKDFIAYNYFGLIGPPGMPAAIVDKLHDAVVKVVAMPEVVAQFQEQGMNPVAGSPEQFAKLMATDLDLWTQVIKEAGIEPQ